MSKALSNYTKVIVKLQEFKDENAKLFAELESLEDLQRQTESELKSEARELGEDISNSMVSVKVVRKWKKWFCPEILKKDFKKDYKVLVENGAIEIKETVNNKIADNLAKDELVSRKALSEAYHEEEMSSAVSIKLL